MRKKALLPCCAPASLHPQFHESRLFVFLFALRLSRDPLILCTLPASKSPSIERCSFRKSQFKCAVFEDSHCLQLLITASCMLRGTACNTLTSRRKVFTFRTESGRGKKKNLMILRKFIINTLRTGDADLRF